MGTKLYQDDRRDDVRRRLLGSVCMYRGRPVYVRHTAGTRVDLMELISGARHTVEHTDPAFDYRSPRLGYMNLENQAFYLTRQPSRDNSSAGLTQNMVVLPNGQTAPGFAGSEMGKAILADHPSYQTAVQRVTDEDWESCAFHRHMCVSRLGLSFGLHYRDRLVGIAEHGRVRLLQSGESSFLDRIIRKAGVTLV